MSPRNYLRTVLQEMFRKLKNLIIADKDGNWHLHVDIVWSLMPVSRDFNAVNHLQHA